MNGIPQGDILRTRGKEGGSEKQCKEREDSRMLLQSQYHFQTACAFAQNDLLATSDFN